MFKMGNHNMLKRNLNKSSK